MSDQGEVAADMVYKIVGQAEWRRAQAAGVYEGSADDRRDGFIHLSAADQIEATVTRHFSHRTGLVVVAFAVADLGPTLKWERSRGGALFPHLYGPLDPRLARSVEALATSGDGRQ